MKPKQPRSIVRYEHRSEPLLPSRFFVRRFLRHVLVASAIAAFSLLIGVLGYHHFAGLSWIDSLLNASMILGGMGPVSDLPNDSSKLFASFYALFAGVAFLATSAVLFAPVAHRLLHTLHLEGEGNGPEQPPPA
ncbi:MAG: hypothetical protein ACRDHG_05350 [Anaerolineales bacterium]